MNESEKEKLRLEHEKEIRKLNAEHGVAWTGSVMPDGWTKESLKAKVLANAENRSLNFIPLKWWESLGAGLMTFNWFPGLSLSIAVCMQKQACRDWLFEEDEK